MVEEVCVWRGRRGGEGRGGGGGGGGGVEWLITLKEKMLLEGADRSVFFFFVDVRR